MTVVAIGDNITDCYVDIGQMFPGGNAVNVAVHAARAGTRSAYVGVIGDDDRGGQLRDALVAEGVAVDRLSVAAGQTAFAAVGHVDDERVFGGVERGVALFSPSERDLDFVAQFDIAHTTYCSGMESVLPELARVARVSFDFDARTDDGYADQLLEHVWAAEFSASHLSDQQCEELLRWAHGKGARLVLATRGSLGSMLFDGTKVLRSPATSVEVVDTLGAGDAFIGRALHGLAIGESPAELIAASGQAASVACSTFGGFGHGLPMPADLTERLNRTFAATTPTASQPKQ